MATDVHPAIAELTQDGDTFSFEDYCKRCGGLIENMSEYCPPTMGGDHEPDLRTLRLKIEPDQISSVFDMDDEVEGKLAFVEWYRDGSMVRGRTTNAYGHYERPDGFDGRALKLTGNFDDVWWQPPTDIVDLPAARENLRNLLEYGYCGLVVELLDGEDAYLRPIVVDTASLWGIEPFPDREYVAEVVGELVAEVLA